MLLINSTTESLFYELFEGETEETEVYENNLPGQMAIDLSELGWIIKRIDVKAEGFIEKTTDISSITARHLLILEDGAVVGISMV